MNDRLTLTELQLLIRDSIYLSMPGFYWVVAEIAEIRDNYTGHCYMELIEKHADEQNVRARIKAVIWNSRNAFVRSYFENITGETLKPGIKILVKARVEYHEIYGLSLIVTDIDPSFTLGEMALKRLQILKRLEDEGVLNMNKDLNFPLVPQRVAIISSRNAAGYTDFMKHLTGNIRGYKFYTWLAEATMQGNDTEAGIIAAFERIASNISLFDAVVIIRGGGSQTDLSWFDNYNIAYYITQFPIPVLTGIGHEKDSTVADMVANKSLKTPTAVADYLVECMTAAETLLSELSSEITVKGTTLLQENREKIDSFRIKLIPLARFMISEIREELSETIIDMINTGKGYILKAGLIPSDLKSRLGPAARSLMYRNESAVTEKKNQLLRSSSGFLTNLNQRVLISCSSLKILDPVNVLKRGFTITFRKGQIIKSVKQVNEGEIIDTLFYDGSVKSKINHIDPADPTDDK